MIKYFDGCTAILGDFNLSHRNEQEKNKLETLCQDKRFSALNEITRTISNNQLDYILINIELKKSSYVTSYHNFVSDHNTITLRFNLSGCALMKNIKERITFDQESHLKSKTIGTEEYSDDELNTGRIQSSSSDDHDVVPIIPPSLLQNDNQVFKRRFKNPDMATCWLNSCLQMVLSAMDQNPNLEDFNSELGAELKKLQINQSGGSLDPTSVKDIIVACEDIRIATRLSDIQQELLTQEEIERQSRHIQGCRLDLRSGQQCVRDFFVALQENLVNWPEVYSYFAYNVIASTTCSGCKYKSSSELTQMYDELPVPPDNSSIRSDVEQLFNGSEIVEHNCKDGCKKKGQGEKRTTLKSIRDTKFIILILKRAVPSENGYQLVENRVNCTEPVELRYFFSSNITKLICLFQG